MQQIEVIIHDQRIPLPTYGSEMAAAFDLRASIQETLVIPPQGTAKIGAGISVFLNNPSFASLIMPRSSLGNRGLMFKNTIGLIDADYQGELIMNAFNRSDEPLVIEPLERIAQLMIVPILRPEIQIVSQFSTETTRGAGGFGSTGKH